LGKKFFFDSKNDTFYTKNGAGTGDVTVHLDNFTFLLPLCDTSFQSRTGNLVFGLLLGGVPLVNFASHRKESGLLSDPSSFLLSIEQTSTIRP
jgi:hypothetical protein